MYEPQNQVLNLLIYRAIRNDTQCSYQLIRSLLNDGRTYDGNGVHHIDVATLIYIRIRTVDEHIHHP